MRENERAESDNKHTYARYNAAHARAGRPVHGQVPHVHARRTRAICRAVTLVTVRARSDFASYARDMARAPRSAHACAPPASHAPASPVTPPPSPRSRAQTRRRTRRPPRQRQRQRRRRRRLRLRRRRHRMPPPHHHLRPRTTLATVGGGANKRAVTSVSVP